MPYRPNTHLVTQLRDAAVLERDELVRFKLKESADNLLAALVNFSTVPTGELLATLNSEWAHGVRILGTAGLQVARPQ
jgi:hypothetical protein